MLAESAAFMRHRLVQEQAVAALSPQTCAVLLAHLTGDGLAFAVQIDPDHLAEAP